VTTSDTIRERLLEEARRPASELLAPLAQAQAMLLAALEGVSETQARFRPPGRSDAAQGEREGEDAWCIDEVLRHLVQAEEGVADRVEKLARGEPAEGSIPGRLGEHEGASLLELKGLLEASHQRLLSVARGLSGQERLDTTARHQFFGDLNCRAWLAMYALHLRSHARQVGDVKTAPGFPTA
jgi:hypothetical protein